MKPGFEARWVCLPKIVLWFLADDHKSGRGGIQARTALPTPSNPGPRFLARPEHGGFLSAANSSVSVRAGPRRPQGTSPHDTDDRVAPACPCPTGDAFPVLTPKSALHLRLRNTFMSKVGPDSSPRDSCPHCLPRDLRTPGTALDSEENTCRSSR